MDVFLDVVGERRDALRNAAVRGAEEVGLFDLLSSRDGSGSPRTARWMAGTLHVSEHRLQRLTDLLAAEGVLHASSTADGRAYRLEERPSWTSRDCGTWNHVGRVFRRDEPLTHPDARLAYLTYVDAWGRRVAPAVWNSVAPPTGRLLDVGGGLGAYSLAWVSRAEANTATILDLPETIAAASAAGAHHARIGTVCGDIRAFQALAPYDVVLLANVLHLHGEEACAAILDRGWPPSVQAGSWSSRTSTWRRTALVPSPASISRSTWPSTPRRETCTRPRI